MCWLLLWLSALALGFAAWRALYLREERNLEGAEAFSEGEREVWRGRGSSWRCSLSPSPSTWLALSGGLQLLATLVFASAMNQRVVTADIAEENARSAGKEGEMTETRLEEALLELPRLPEETFAELLAFGGLDEKARRAMRLEAERLLEGAAAFMAGVYDHLSRHPGTAKTLGWEGRVPEEELYVRRAFFGTWLARTIGVDTSPARKVRRTLPTPAKNATQEALV